MNKLDKVNKKILKLLASQYPDFVELNYLYGLRKDLTEADSGELARGEGKALKS